MRDQGGEEPLTVVIWIFLKIQFNKQCSG